MATDSTKTNLVLASPTPSLRGLGPLLSTWDPHLRRRVRHGDRVLVLLAAQEGPSENGPWVAQDGDWERPVWPPSPPAAGLVALASDELASWLVRWCPDLPRDQEPV